MSPFLGSLVESDAQNVGIDCCEYDWRSTGIEQRHAERRIGGPSGNTELSVPVGSGNDALARVKYVRMPQIANVSEINRKVVHSDVQYVDPIERRNRISIVNALC